MPGISAAVEGTAPFDRAVARSLAGDLAGDHRLRFAEAFSHAVLTACWQARQVAQPLPALPTDALGTVLTADARQVAERVGTALGGLDPLAAAHRVGAIYTATLPDAYRAAHGIFYTPPALVDRLLAMTEDAGVAWDSARVLDPACGGGAFLIPIARRMIASLRGTEPALLLQQLSVRLRGFERDPFGAWLAQAAVILALQDVSAAAHRPVPQLVGVRDSLALDRAEFSTFDLVVGNPPYGRVTLPPEQRAAFARSVYGHANLYGLFTDAALHWVKPGGVIGYVTPTSMLSGLYYKALRDLLTREAPPFSVNFVSQRTGVFADVLQETMLATYRCQPQRQTGKVGFITIGEAGRATCRDGGRFDLSRQGDGPWLLPREPRQTELTRRLRSMPHRLATFGYGVSTGPLVWNRYKEHFRRHPTADALPVIWAESIGSDGRFIWRSERRNHAPWFVPRRPKDDWLIVRTPCVLLQRTTAKEQPRRLIAAELPAAFIDAHGGVVIENHLNMVRPRTGTPAVPAAVIAALLNSAAVDAAFRCLNGSVAVSAYELEELPLPHPHVLERITALIAAQAPQAEVEAAIAGGYGNPDAAAAA